MLRPLLGDRDREGDVTLATFSLASSPCPATGVPLPLSVPQPSLR